ncbi:hypothetical protein JOQ06_010204 [Pogonophryne albipinna]|uniref:Uncharacterized protein n=1 Tax=Pogonophryne albipinna TaxID=1090488 RepID=A0AAD6FFH5_9TELE|nr:hypothetical protein JOQ06_010204 [Pogonophryne albipinna]
MNSLHHQVLILGLKRHDNSSAQSCPSGRLPATACMHVDRNYYNNNNGGTNGGDTSNSPSSGGPQANSPPDQSSYGSYYQNDGAYTASPAAKAPKKKPPMHKAGKAAFPGPPGANSGSAEGYQQASSPPGQGAYNQYSQGYGQGKKSFNQSQGGAGGYSYSTAYPSQVTGGAGSQDYIYEDFNSSSSYNSQSGGGGGGGGGGGANNTQGFGTNHSQYNNPVGYGRDDSSMNYQYR